jgi:CheY-like chemotaxis protein
LNPAGWVWPRRVEDDGAVEALGSLGYDVLEAGSGGDVLRLMEESTGVGLLLTDVIMPGMHGRPLRSGQNFASPPLR